MHVLMRTEERPQEPLGGWSLPSAGAPYALSTVRVRQRTLDWRLSRKVGRGADRLNSSAGAELVAEGAQTCGAA